MTSTVYTAVDQQLPTMQFYPNSVWTTPLPRSGSYAVQNNLLPNSDAIVRQVYNNSDSPASIPSVVTTDPTLSTAASQRVFYYSGPSDPIYKVISCGTMPQQARNQPNGKYFHLKVGAKFSSYVTDQSFTDWDQSTDLDSSPGGRILDMYTYCLSGTCPKTLPSNCACTTTACADNTSACQLTNFAGYCDVSFPFDDKLNGIGDGMAWSSMNNGGGAGFLRGNEIISGTINHALLVNNICVAPGPSFPATGDVFACTGSLLTNAPHNGALFWIDSAYACNALPAWQRAVCQAVQTYGAYQRDTAGGSTGVGLYIVSVESQIAEHDAGLPDVSNPFLQYMKTFSTADRTKPVYCTGNPVTRCNIQFLTQMPGLITGDAGNGYKPHLHVVDPCVPKKMAGLSATCMGPHSKY